MRNCDSLRWRGETTLPLLRPARDAAWRCRRYSSSGGPQRRRDLGVAPRGSCVLGLLLGPPERSFGHSDQGYGRTRDFGRAAAHARDFRNGLVTTVDGAVRMSRRLQGAQRHDWQLAAEFPAKIVDAGRRARLIPPFIASRRPGQNELLVRRLRQEGRMLGSTTAVILRMRLITCRAS